MSLSLKSVLFATALLGVASAASAAEPVRNVVLVHGAFADGSSWRGVYDVLVKDGYHVSVAQIPLTSMADDVVATKRVLARLDGPAILVGHSYGGVVITQAGVDPKVVGLVYVAAFAPDVGQSAFDQFAVAPPPATFMPEPTADGFLFLRADTFRAGFAADLKPADADFMRDSQVPVLAAGLQTKVDAAAWKTRPSWYVVATEDGAIDPRLERATAKRIGATTTEVKGSHVVFASQPASVARVIEAAAQGSTPTK